MGVENRDWYRDESRRGRGGPTPTWVWVVGAAIVVVVLALISPSARDRIGIRLPFGLEETFGGEGRSAGFLVFPLAGAPPISLGGSLYARDDPWRAWLAPESACPRGEDRDAPAVVQTHVLLCLVNYARARQDLGSVALSPLLSAASAAKAGEIERCREFEHEPCGRPANAAALGLGYRGSFGENLYIAERPMTSPRVAVDQWLNSPGHRENLFRPEWRVLGIARLDDVTFGPFGGAVLWVNEFGDRYEAGRPSV